MPRRVERLAAIARAEDECARCRGREFGDCSDECRYWSRTATEAERDAVAGRQADYNPAKHPCVAKHHYGGHPLWNGPVHSGPCSSDEAKEIKECA